MSTKAVNLPYSFNPEEDEPRSDLKFWFETGLGIEPDEQSFGTGLSYLKQVLLDRGFSQCSHVNLSEKSKQNTVRIGVSVGSLGSFSVYSEDSREVAEKIQSMSTFDLKGIVQLDMLRDFRECAYGMHTRADTFKAVIL